MRLEGTPFLGVGLKGNLNDPAQKWGGGGASYVDRCSACGAKRKPTGLDSSNSHWLRFQVPSSTVNFDLTMSRPICGS